MTTGSMGNTPATSSGYAGQPLSPSRASGGARQVASSSGTTNLADLLERVLDKGIVIAGDITVSLGQVELLSIKVRLLVASIDKAQEIGIDWWRSDPALSSHAKQMETQNDQLKSRLDRIEEHLKAIAAPQPQGQLGAGTSGGARPQETADKNHRGQENPGGAQQR